MTERSDVQEGIGHLVSKGWTIAAIADDLGVAWYTIQRWQDGKTYPQVSGAVVAALKAILDKPVPKKRRYGERGHYLQRRARGKE